MTNREIKRRMDEWVEKRQAERVLRLAESRGTRRCTFATAEEMSVPGYSAAYERGAKSDPDK